MKKEEYEEYKKLSPIDRILFLNSGTITENLHKMIEISEFEKNKNECIEISGGEL